MLYRDSRRALLIASTFDSSEQQRLLLFLAAPYCTGLNPENDCLRLMRVFFQKLNEQQKPEHITDKSLFNALYEGQVFSPEAFNEVTAEAFRLVKKFVAIEISVGQLNERDELTYLLRYYKGKSLTEKFWDVRESLSKKQKDRKDWEAEDYLWSYLVEKEEVEFSSLHNRKKDDLNLLKATQALNEFFLVESLILVSTLYTQSRLTPLVFPPLQELLPYDPDAPSLKWFFSKPLGRLFIMSLHFMGADTKQAEFTFEKYEALLLEAEGVINERHYNHFERIGMNYLLSLGNAGKKEYRAPLFKIFQRRVESGRVYVDGKISADEMQSIVLIGLRVKEDKWVDKFLTDNEHKIISAESPQAVYDFNRAVYYFYTKQYQKTLELLKSHSLQSKASETQYKASSKILEIMVFHELGTGDLDATLDAAYVHFFRALKSVETNPRKSPDANAETDESSNAQRKKGRKKNSDKAAEPLPDEAEARKNEAFLTRVNNYVNFIKMMKQIVKVGKPNKRDTIVKLIEKINKNPHMAERDWLIEKLQTLLEKLGGRLPSN